MSDIVERLIGPDYWISGNADGSEGHNNAPFDAAIEIKRLREALEIIAGDRPCLDNLMGNVDVARAALES